eukprot:14868521-Alexandrium_andersonii.AAC.1
MSAWDAPAPLPGAALGPPAALHAALQPGAALHVRHDLAASGTSAAWPAYTTAPSSFALLEPAAPPA